MRVETPKRRRFVRFCLWSLALAAIATVVVNLTVAELPPMPAAEGRYISVQGRDIHYVERPGQGMSVVMLHGLPGTSEDFDPLIPKLPGLHLVSIDRPGFGWSRGGWLPYQDQIEVVHAVLNRLELAPAILVGWSFGGSLALGVARRYPEDVARMVLIAPAAGGMRSYTRDLVQARYLQFSQQPVVKSVISRTYGNIATRVSAYFGARGAFAPAPVDPTYQERLLAVSLTPGNLDAFSRDQLEYNATMQWLDDEVAEVRVSSTVIAAEGDQLVPVEHARRLAKTLPHTELITVDGNHMIPYTHPDVVADEIRASAGARAKGS
ncbi:alpha/beta fold hydrolase [Mycolicibacterium monacense]|uniref:Alpha/beta hydrolase n=1 Tax=Mycolicibacterium monacense TaxID=85693 RepID=A0AAD1J239_MYCMB|nr:alpha/beta hydrolase [Mycolicibacterium monacense]MDA4101523.1 alpha/beta hydrolase [Mycolicibacterium monacense DSM 44395]ORB20537.1 alpha/beta hydrolase [Mycolicibacterium monacense DSM 44395]QHP88165.1 alpha/beta hydrolase [Mycolicibacterium monacense DSM 44395]BBZ64453.1 alpha/beta hydrolase [Mycolicibacterium monacense]